MVAYDILLKEKVIIPKDTKIDVHEIFIYQNAKYIITLIEYPPRYIEVNPYDEYIKRNTIVKCEDRECRTLKEVEEFKG